MTVTQNYDNIIPSTPILSADPNVKEDVMTDQQKITILYCRLSNADSQDRESNSIQNQRELLTKYAQDHGYTNLKILVDDGYTGTNFQRPGVQEGFELVKQGLVGCWLCKDLSRFGRDYLTVGQYTDIIFPSYDVRFIAVNDGVDSQRGDGEGFAAVRNLFNAWYPRDTSKKVRISAAPAANTSASRPTATAATQTTRTSGFWTRKPRRLSSASLISALTAKARSRFPGFLNAIRFLRPRLCMPAARESLCQRIRMDGRINPSSGFWNGRNTPAAPVISRPTPSPTS